MKDKFADLSIDEVRNDIKEKELLIEQKTEEMTKIRDNTSLISSKIQELEKRKRKFIDENYSKIRSSDHDILEDTFKIPNNTLKEKVTSFRWSLTRNDEFSGVDQSDNFDNLVDEVLKFVDEEVLDIKQKKNDLEKKLTEFKTLWEDIEKINSELNLTKEYLQLRIKENIAKALSISLLPNVEKWITQENIYDCLMSSL